MKLSEQIKISPFLRILPPLILGIILSHWVNAPLWIVATASLGVYCTAWGLRKTASGSLYTRAAIATTGLLLGILSTPHMQVPRGERILMIVEMSESPAKSDPWQRTTGRVGFYRPLGSKQRGDWVPCHEKIQLYIDTCYRLNVGEQFAMQGYLNPIDSTGSSYGRLMLSRGMSARSYLTRGGLIARSQKPRWSASLLAVQGQQWAIERLSRLQINETYLNLLLTLVAGERRGLDPKIRDDYARTGVSHILSVSGLHMGFVLILVNLLTGWIVMLRRGHLIRNALVIMAMWGYAVIAGLSPPVIRSALMMSIAQVALGSSVRGDRYNLLLGAATLMLAINPNYLFDISFQLSFLSILSILFLYPRLYARKLSKNRFADCIWSCLLLGLAAQVGTLPLVAYSFGMIPLWALVINPLVVFTSFIVVSAGFCWLLLPLSWLNGIFSLIIQTTLQLQNSLLHWAAFTPYATIEGITLNAWGVTSIYALFVAGALWWKGREESSGVQHPTTQH